MTKPVTIVIPALDDRALLAAHLPAVLAELRARNVGDEVVVVDDTGSGVLESWLTQEFPPPRPLMRPSSMCAAWCVQRMAAMPLLRAAVSRPRRSQNFELATACKIVRNRQIF